MNGKVPAESSLTLCPLLSNPLPVIATLFCQRCTQDGTQAGAGQSKGLGERTGRTKAATASQGR